MILRLCCLVSTDDIRKVLSDEYYVPLRGTRLNCLATFSFRSSELPRRDPRGSYSCGSLTKWHLKWCMMIEMLNLHLHPHISAFLTLLLCARQMQHILFNHYSLDIDRKIRCRQTKRSSGNEPCVCWFSYTHFFISFHAPTSDQTAAEITTHPLSVSSEPNMSECVRFSFRAPIFVLWHLLNDRLSFHLTIVEAGTNGTGTCAPTTHQIHVRKTRAWVCLQWAETTENTVWLDSTPQPAEYVCVSVCRNSQPRATNLCMYACLSLVCVCMSTWVRFYASVCVRRSVVTYSCDVDHQHPLLWVRRINKPRCSLLAVWYWSQMHVNRA